MTIKANELGSDNIILKFKKDELRAARFGDAMYNFCVRNKIKVVEPRSGADNLYHTFEIHLDTLNKQVLFEARFTSLIKKLLKAQNQNPSND